jgi:hypothetical protein
VCLSSVSVPRHRRPSFISGATGMASAGVPLERHSERIADEGAKQSSVSGVAPIPRGLPSPLGRGHRELAPGFSSTVLVGELGAGLDAELAEDAA